MILILIAVLQFTGSCSSDENSSETIDLRINHFQQTAVGVGQRLVMQVQESDKIGTDEWQYFYSNIEGFEYKSGFIYTLSVEKENISNPPADGSSIKYTLNKIKSTEKVAPETTFKILLKSKQISDPPSFVTGDLSSNYKILNEIEIDCEDLCEDLSVILETEDEVSGIFKHAENNSLRLIRIKSD
tara:strand:+ start:755 stop:1312 length:558 start_codon:yes stop_codon:yes gene_type:complete